MIVVDKNIRWVIKLINRIIIQRGKPINWGVTNLFPGKRDEIGYNTFYFLNICLHQLFNESMWSETTYVQQRVDHEVFVGAWDSLEHAYPELKKER